MNDIILYHGSRAGIDGDIQPISRVRCDFGKGFYMGDNPMQVKGLAVRGDFPVFYELKLKLSEIPDDKILFLNDEEWIYAVLANRKLSDDFNKLTLAKDWLKRLDEYDVVIGAIADDSMRHAIERFSEGLFTDTALMACLRTVDYGMQYVAKTEFACSKIEILSERRFTKKDFTESEQYNRQKAKEGFVNFREISAKYNKSGLYLDEIIENEQRKGKNKGVEH